jgi:hypothetical protein
MDRDVARPTDGSISRGDAPDRTHRGSDRLVHVGGDMSHLGDSLRGDELIQVAVGNELVVYLSADRKRLKHLQILAGGHLKPTARVLVPGSGAPIECGNDYPELSIRTWDDADGRIAAIQVRS